MSFGRQRSFVPEKKASEYRAAAQGCQSAASGRAGWLLLLLLGGIGGLALWLLPAERPQEGPPAISTPLPDPKAVPPKEAPPQPEENGLRVTVLQAASDQPIEGVKLSLFRKAAPGAVQETGGRKVPANGYLWNVGLSNLAGRLTIKRPEPASYFWTAEKQGWATLEGPPFNLESPGSPESDGEEKRYEIVLRMEREATLQVELTGQGHPLKGAQALLRKQGAPPLVATADSMGIARWSALSAGDYWLFVAPPGFDLSPYFWPDRAPALIDPADFKLGVGEARVEKIAFEGKSPASLAGGVRVNGAAPEEKLQVNLALLEAPRAFARYPLPPQIAPLDSSGLFRMENLYPSRYRATLLATSGGSTLAEKEIVLTAGAAGSLDFSIELGRLRGQIVDGKGAPVPQSRVVVRGTGERSGAILAYWTDGEGRFRTDPMHGGEYELTVHPSGGSAWSQTLRVTAGESDLGKIAPGAGSTGR